MPLFFFLSGYLYNEVKWKEKSFLFFTKTRVKAYLKPFFIFLLINIFIYNPFREISKGGCDFSSLIESIKINIKAVIPFTNDYTNFGPAVIPLWFFLCGFFSCLIFRLVFYIENNYFRFICGFILLTIYGLMLKDGSYSFKPFFPWHIETAFVGAALMIAGFFYKKYTGIVYKRKALVSNILMLLFPIGVFLIEINGRVDMFCYAYGNNVYLFFISAVFVIIGLFAIFEDHNITIPILETFGRETILIIGLNIIVISFSKQVWYRLPVIRNINYHYLICTFIVMSIMWLLIFIKNKIIKTFPKSGY